MQALKVILSSIIFFSFGCATMSKEECVQADWKNIGLMDAQKGRLEEYLNRHQYSCEEVLDSATKNEYAAGWGVGQTIKKSNEDKSFFADLNRTVSLLNGQSPTQTLDTRKRNIEHEISALESKAPAGISVLKNPAIRRAQYAKDP